MRLLTRACLIALLAIALIGLWIAPESSAAAIKPLLGCATNTLPANDDGSTGAVALPFSPNFFGTTYGSLYVNNNGNVTFNSALASFIPLNLLSTSRVIIAPFFADVDTRGAGSGVVTYGNTTFDGHTTFCVNWVNVGYYISHIDKSNSFQLLLVDRSDVSSGDFDIIFNYDQIKWEAGDASGGSGGLGGASARAGYANGTTSSFELGGSGIPGKFLDSNATTGLIHNSLNSGTLGRYVFHVRGGVPQTPITGVGGIAELPEVTGAAPLQTSGPSGLSAGVVAAVAAGAGAVVVALGSAAWFAQRRRLS